MVGYQGKSLVGYRTTGNPSECPPGFFKSPGPEFDAAMEEFGLIRSPNGCWSLSEVQELQASTVSPPKAENQWPIKDQIQGEEELSSSDTEREFLRIINNYRIQHGIHPLKMNKHLLKAARWHSDYMRKVGIVSHEIAGEPHGDSVYDRAPNAGYIGNGIGENIAFKSNGYTPMEAFLAWKASPGHNTQMLDRDWKVIGVGDGQTMWTTDFGNSFDGSEEEETKHS